MPRLTPSARERAVSLLRCRIDRPELIEVVPGHLDEHELLEGLGAAGVPREGCVEDPPSEVGGKGPAPEDGRGEDAELARLYRGAACVAYPSLYEGFGIPILEAMACGAPVVTTRGTAMEEVADGAAVLVDSRDSAEIAAGIERAATERDTLVARGLERARAFRWDAVAAATVEVYREAVA